VAGAWIQHPPAHVPALSIIWHVRQIHSATCVGAAGRHGVLGEGDALLEDTPGSVVAIQRPRTAFPICWWMTGIARCRGAFGWRGTVAGIAQRAVEAMRAQFGSGAGDLHAALARALGPCCYEVGPEVAAQFGRRQGTPRSGRRLTVLAG